MFRFFASLCNSVKRKSLVVCVSCECVCSWDSGVGDRFCSQIDDVDVRCRSSLFLLLFEFCVSWDAVISAWRDVIGNGCKVSCIFLAFASRQCVQRKIRCAFCLQML